MARVYRVMYDKVISFIFSIYLIVKQRFFPPLMLVPVHFSRGFKYRQDVFDLDLEKDQKCLYFMLAFIYLYLCFNLVCHHCLSPFAFY